MQFTPFSLSPFKFFFLCQHFDSFFPPDSHAMSSGALSGKYSASKSHEIYHYPISIIQFRLSNVHTLNSWFRALAICFTYFKNGVIMTDVQTEEGFKHRNHLCYSFTSRRHFQSVYLSSLKFLDFKWRISISELRTTGLRKRIKVIRFSNIKRLPIMWQKRKITIIPETSH